MDDAFKNAPANEEDMELTIFKKIGDLLESMDEEVEASDVIGALMRSAAVVVAHCPEAELRESYTSHSIALFTAYVYAAVTSHGLELTENEKARRKQLEALFGGQGGALQ